MPRAFIAFAFLALTSPAAAFQAGGDPAIEAQWAAQTSQPNVTQPATVQSQQMAETRPRIGLFHVLFPRAGDNTATQQASMPRTQGAPAEEHGNQIDPAFLPALVDFPTSESPGTIVIDPRARYLYLVLEGGKAQRYGVGVGRDGFGWSGTVRVGRKAEWPTWTPPAAMRQRQPYLPVSMAGGPDNPLGARALYLYRGGSDTLYRIHGSNAPWTIGQAVSSGCFRMRNEDVIELYSRVPVGTKVVVL
jgi:lipoprotein-anchoring transpeptidase ErfK/SrfK